MRYHTPGVVIVVPQKEEPAASVVAFTVFTVVVEPQFKSVAPPQRSLATEGGGGVQLIHCTVVVRQVDCVPHELAVFQCAYNVPLKVFVNCNGEAPCATTGPFEDPLLIVM
jgi:hypothetical protein